MKKIAILTSGHSPFDERIFYKFANSFYKNGFQVKIICSTQEISTNENEIFITGFNGANLPKTQKINKFIELLQSFSPDIIIGCEPLTILPAKKYKNNFNKNVKIILDVTEWYPENVSFKFHGIKKYFSYAVLYMFNIYAVNLADKIIVGEKLKLKRYRIIAPFKNKIIIGYYPVLDFFKHSKPIQLKDKINLGYAGVINFERGILNLLNVAKLLKEINIKLEVTLTIIGKFQYKNEEETFLNEIKNIDTINIELISWGKYFEISDKLKITDICFDLRKRNFFYNNSLPIKIFEYMACGKPVIYSDIKALQEIPVNEFGFLVDPENLLNIVEKIMIYVNNNDLMIKHSENARKLVEEKYNWEKIEGKLISFIE